MDILHVGKTSGIGGLTLYLNGEAFPIRNEKQPGDPVFTSKLVEETDNLIVLEFVAENVGPASNPTPSEYGFNQSRENISDVRVFVEGGRANDKLELGIALPNWVMRPFIVTVKRDTWRWGMQKARLLDRSGCHVRSEKYVRVENDKGEHRVLVGYHRDKPFLSNQGPVAER